MRRKVSVETLRQFMRELAAAARTPGKVYLTGGAHSHYNGLIRRIVSYEHALEREQVGDKTKPGLGNH
jgi:hypothetical protein